MVTQTRLNVTVYVQCLYLLQTVQTATQTVQELANARKNERPSSRKVRFKLM